MSESVHREGAISAAVMDSMSVHPRWDDGRRGFVWCRLDALIDPVRLLYVELTWNDDGEDDEVSDGATKYFSPVLAIETHRIVVSGGPGCDDLEAIDDPKMLYDRGYLQPIGRFTVRLTSAESMEVASSDPAALLEKYAKDIANLPVWGRAAELGPAWVRGRTAF